MTQTQSSLFFLDKIMIIICLSGTIGFALSFTKYFNYWYYLPFIPNIFDSIFLIFSVSYLSYRLWSIKRNETK